MVAANHQQLLQPFFASMAMHLKHKDAVGLSTLFHVPAVFVDDGDKLVCANEQEVHQLFNNFFSASPTKAATQFEFVVSHAVKLSDSLFFVQVDWDWKDDAGNLLLSRGISYTLQDDGSGKFEVVVVVVDDSSELIKYKPD